jgi:hypothetical protein
VRLCLAEGSAATALWRFPLTAGPVLADDDHMETVTTPEVRKLGYNYAQTDPPEPSIAWHFAVNDCQDQRRVMHRILLAGSKPVRGDQA